VISQKGKNFPIESFLVKVISSIKDPLALIISALTSVTLRRAVKIAPAVAIQISYSVFGLCCEGERGLTSLTNAGSLV
jgi:hypothetical protein